LLAAVFLCVGTLAHAQRVVSLNLCADDYLILLAPERVAAVSVLARDPALSVVAQRAATLPWVRADAEAVLRLRPDLVLAGAWGAQTTLAALERRGIRVERVGAPADFEGIRTETRRVAAILGVVARGETMLAEMERRLAGIPRHGSVRAVSVAPRGYTAGRGTMTDSVLTAAGLTNIGEGRRLALEAIVARPPEVMVVAEAPEYPSLATDMLAHPALRGIPRRSVPPALTICGGPWTAEAVEILAR
jgi:iron complex transport system substrate-binding protein